MHRPRGVSEVTAEPPPGQSGAHTHVRIYHIGNEGITLCRKAPTTGEFFASTSTPRRRVGPLGTALLYANEDASPGTAASKGRGRWFESGSLQQRVEREPAVVQISVAQ